MNKTAGYPERDAGGFYFSKVGWAALTVLETKMP